MNRRDFIAATAAATATGLAGRLAAAPPIDTAKLPSQSAIFANVRKMNALGPRFCGNKAHTAYTKWLENEMTGMGLTLDNIPHDKLLFWEPRQVSLKTVGGETIPIGSYNQWCKPTGEGGVTGPLFYLGRYEGPSQFAIALEPERRAVLDIPADLTGKIVLVECAVGYRPLDRLFPPKDVVLWFNKEDKEPFPARQGPSITNQTMMPRDLITRLKQAGAIGVIFAWVGVADADAQGQAKTGTGSQTYNAADLPSLWVVPTTGARLRKMAEAGESVTMVVTATIVPNTPTHTIVATLPGLSEESIILWTHVDGQNAVEENGGSAIVAILSYLTKLPREQRARTIHVVMSEGHFAEQYLPVPAWIDERPQLAKDAVAFVSIEHLGCMEWLSDPVANTYKPTGRSELSMAFCATPAIQQAGAKVSAAQRSGRGAIIDKTLPVISPGVHGYNKGHIPCFAYISVPSYLVSYADDGHIAKLNPKLYYDQVLMLTQLIRDLDATPKSVLRPA